MKLFSNSGSPSGEHGNVFCGYANTIKYLTLFVIAFLAYAPSYAQITYTSADNKQSDWETASTWTFTGGSSPTQPGNPTNSSASAIKVYGYVRAESGLTINNANPVVTVYDTLFVVGDVSLGSGASLNVPANGLLVITGNLTLSGSFNLSNGGNIVVKGNVSVTNGSITNSSDHLYIFGSTNASGGGTIDGCNPYGGCTPASQVQTKSQLQSDNPALYNFVSATTYTWTGSGGAVWSSQGNWTPTRSSPASNDILIFNASGSNKNISSVPTETVSQITVTGNATYTFTPASNGRIITITSTSGYALQIDNGSKLTIGSGNSLGISMAASSQSLIGGELNLANGNFDVSGATLILHTNSTPLARTSGQVSANASTVLKFGDTGYTSGSTITLPNSIFVSAPTINSLIINRTNGATLGNQSITVNSTATFTLGDLTTTAAGTIKFSSTATSPTESTSSKIIGYADMNLRTVGTGALNFLGLNIASGADNLGSILFTRRTGSSGINTFNANQSIASTWDITSAAEPTSGRSIFFSWQSAFDNVTTASKKFQVYIFSSGPGWTTIGPLQALASVGPPRQSVAVSTTKLTDTFTLTDETQTLPIELVSFTAKATATSVILNWKTATEKNNDYFLIEHTISGQDFKTIAKVIGAGTSLSENNYSLTDEKPKQGVNYYRLKQVDFDGQSSYSEVVKVEFTGKINSEIVIYPNPVDNILKFDNLNEDTWVSLIDGQGKVIFTSTVKSDNASIELTDYHLPSGMYFIRILDSTKTQVRKIIIK